jgi:predicted membrane-bound dolichyl-phosphate-mannose-protein mannosyltransferase
MEEQTNTPLLPEPYPVQLSIIKPEKHSKKMALLFVLVLIPKLVYLVPHLVILYALNIAAFVIAILGNFAVLFTGKFPASWHKFITDILRWQVRVNAFFLGLVDKYPPFRLNE